MSALTESPAVSGHRKNGSAPAGAPAGTPVAARTRAMLEGPIVPTLLRLAAPNVVVMMMQALITTAVGLVVAVPSLIAYNHFVRRMNVMLTIAENQARALRTALADRGTPDDRSTPRRREESIGRSIRTTATEAVEV